MRIPGLVSVFAFVAVAAAACSDGATIAAVAADGGSGGGGAPSAGGGSNGGGPGASAVDPYIKALCGLARTCCAPAGFPASALADCESEVVRQTDVLQFAAEGTVHIDAAEIARCASTLSGFSSACIYDTPAIRAACRMLYEGTRKEGESCRKAEECSGNPVVCLKVQTDGGVTPETGICHVMKRVAVGSPCITDGSDTLRGLTLSTPDATAPSAYCHTADGLFCPLGQKVCTRFTANGAACTLFNECGPGFYCDTTCLPVKAKGGACTRGGECTEALVCANGVCDSQLVASSKLCGGDYN